MFEDGCGPERSIEGRVSSWLADTEIAFTAGGVGAEGLVASGVIFLGGLGSFSTC